MKISIERPGRVRRSDRVSTRATSTTAVPATTTHIPSGVDAVYATFCYSDLPDRAP